MSYTITKTDGTILTTTNMPGGTLLDGTTDTNTGLTLIGRNYPSYGDAQNENFVRLLENFADNVPPTQSLAALSALVGTIWYDTSIKKIRVFDGTNWNPASSTIVANAAPTTLTYTINTGDQWWDTVNNQLNGWSGNSWTLIGPDYGSILTVNDNIKSNVATINANVTQLRVDTGSYMTANVVALNSTISQLRVDTGNYMTANVNTLNSSINQLRISTGNYMTANVAILNVTISQLREDTGSYMTANVATLNSLIQSNFNSLTNTVGQLRTDTGSYMTANVATLNASILNVQNGINSNVATLTATVSVLSSTVSQLRADTGSYITANVNTLNLSIQSNFNSLTNTIGQLRVDTGSYMTANVVTLNSTISQLRTDTGSYMTANVATLNAAINKLRTDTGSYMTANVATLNASITALALSTNSNFALATANAATQQTSIDSINLTLVTRAPLASPAFTGSPTAPTPSPGDNDTSIATTAFVTQAVAAATSGSMQYTVSTSAPSGGANGDFWFQV